MMYLSISFDHRLIDGGTATRFLNDLILQIEALGAE
jgi:pyruvate/2-oxoglutarate dehydrogenase complex dihydrolipoamide acyltransferase (E2) component